MKTTNIWTRLGLTTAASIALACGGMALTACDKTESQSKTTVKTSRETPSGTVKTTETTEKKVETNPK